MLIAELCSTHRISRLLCVCVCVCVCFVICVFLCFCFGRAYCRALFLFRMETESLSIVERSLSRIGKETNECAVLKTFQFRQNSLEVISTALAVPLYTRQTCLQIDPTRGRGVPTRFAPPPGQTAHLTYAPAHRLLLTPTDSCIRGRNHPAPSDWQWWRS